MLDEELERLGVMLGLDRESGLFGCPMLIRAFPAKLGEASYIYEAEEDKALQALRHELEI